ncbi:MAG: hypothetical protein KKH41_02815 [Candidatus Thermoplasmatota archaeon]|nr:hypothetical protein [Euryarchaeota archaeon]MBU4032848.1 hypothetical protein [Candidatus Thermoplasmatota archaeon]MBU4071644.1 hypothetical protein [Candidatus Thermoplasmatota archaeon]MBU4144908.1 hypothetical protein [Candidatus Thermoplasmatota archaeon]MBU4591496.1 hypothetical protein [Candidatus Thermoplasmatota archaeon]
MNKTRTRKRAFPPVFKLLIRGYAIIAFILAMAYFNAITYIPLLIFLISTVSISMVFGMGYLLVMRTRPVRTSRFTIPNTVLFFVKGMMVLYFISMLAEFRILPDRITSYLILGLAGIMVLVGVGSYVLEVFERSRPIPKRKAVSRRKLPAPKGAGVSNRAGSLPGGPYT